MLVAKGRWYLSWRILYYKKIEYTFCMKFNEIPRAVVDFTQEQLEERNRRLSDPRLVAQLENTTLNVKKDFYNVCAKGLEGAGRIIAAPVIGMWEGFVGTPLKTFTHNSAVRNPKHRKVYPNVFATSVSEMLAQYVKGGYNFLQMAGHFTKFTGRASLLAGRYLIGK